MNERMREIFDTIDAVKAKVPETETELRDQLDWLKSDTSYKAPEQHVGQWNLFANILARNIPDIVTDWHKDIVQIYHGNQIAPQD